MPDSLLFALWFSNPFLLWGLGAAALPILIHLLNRRRYREMPWAAMRFLIAAIQKNQRRIQLQQWLLLAVRTLIVLLVALAMAKPFLESTGAVALLPGQRTHWILAVDASMSMDARSSGSRPFEQATQLAAQLAKAARPGDGFSLISLASPPKVLVGAPTFQREAFIQELASLAQTHGPADLPVSFAKIAEVSKSSDIPRKELVVLTDLQAATWNAPGLDGNQQIKECLANLTSAKVRTTLIDLGFSPIENRAITSLVLDPPLVTPNTPATVRATVRNFGSVSAEGLKARLIIDSRLGPEETVSVRPGEDQTVVFSVQFQNPGEHVLQTQLEPDALPIDDQRSLVVPVRPAIPILLVDGDPHPDPLKAETSFLSHALQPGWDEAQSDARVSSSPLSVEVVGESQLATQDLSRYDTVVLANIARFNPAETLALENFLKQGGGIVIFLGDRVVAESYNEVLFRDGQGLLPARLGAALGDPSARERAFQFDPLAFRHPLVSSFAGEAPGIVASLTNAATSRYFKLDVPRGSTTQVALAYSSGDPAVLEAPRERGRVFLVASSADTSWTTWPLHQSFPPVMEQLVLLAAAGRATESNLTVGHPILLTLPSTAAGTEASILMPDNSTQTPRRLELKGSLAQLEFPDTPLSGLYQVQVGPPVDRPFTFAAQTDPAESNLARLTPQALKTTFPGWEFTYDNQWQPLRKDASSVARRGEIHRPLLLLALALLLAEPFLAWRLGNPTSLRS